MPRTSRSERLVSSRWNAAIRSSSAIGQRS
jgi:hypothetical protein